MKIKLKIIIRLLLKIYRLSTQIKPYITNKVKFNARDYLTKK